MQVESFLQDLDLNFFSSKKIDEILAIVGEVKINNIKNKSSLSADQYIEFLTSFGIKIQNIEPTRESKISKNSFDRLITTSEKRVEILKTFINDHYARSCVIFLIHRKNKKRRKLKSEFLKIVQERFFS